MAANDDNKARYGLWVVLIGILTVAVVPVVAALVLGLFPNVKVEAVTAIAGPATSAIAAIAGAYFGITIGLQGKADAEKAKDKAKDEAAQAGKESVAARAVARSFASGSVTADHIDQAIAASMAPPLS